MKIILKPNIKPVKHQLYRIKHRVKEKVKKEIEFFLAVRLIFLVDEVDWSSLIVIHNKRDTKENWVCVDY